jgi:peptidoglycan L-alanyl-D-glutamate endopeptidase CwlK
VSSRSIEDLHPILQPLAIQFLADCKEAGITAFLTCTYRSSAEQDDLYAQGRTKPGKRVTNAKGGQSQHNTTLQGKPAARAFDIAIKNRDGTVNWDASHPHWKQVGVIGKEIGLVWGGDWKIRDLPHFELPGGSGVS